MFEDIKTDYLIDEKTFVAVAENSGYSNTEPE